MWDAESIIILAIAAIGIIASCISIVVSVIASEKESVSNIWDKDYDQKQSKSEIKEEK